MKIIGLEGKVWTRGSKRATERPSTFYVKSVSWAEGDGLRMNAVRTTSDRTQAARFRPEVAAVLAEQLERRDWTGFGLFPTIEDAR